ncbi:MAG TPA: hypothetical protein VLA91_04965 [Acidimicrobiia bacterium]|nr:hypothetical protein [Acidimicrobiia bacterium]
MKGWLGDLTVGGLVGGLVGAIAAVNFVIYTGIEQGYEASLAEVFQHNLIAGIVTVMILIAGPVLGVLTARRLRRRRAMSSQAETNDQVKSSGRR